MVYALVLFVLVILLVVYKTLRRWYFERKFAFERNSIVFLPILKETDKISLDYRVKKYFKKFEISFNPEVLDCIKASDNREGIFFPFEVRIGWFGKPRVVLIEKMILFCRYKETNRISIYFGENCFFPSIEYANYGLRFDFLKGDVLLFDFEKENLSQNQNINRSTKFVFQENVFDILAIGGRRISFGWMNITLNGNNYTFEEI